MTDLLTSDEYENQTAALLGAIQQAGNEVNTAVHKERTGAGDAAATKKAKDHHAALVAELDDVRAAWQGAQAEAVQTRAADLRSQFDQARTRICDHLKDREAAIAAVHEGLKAVISGCENYHAATVPIRAELAAFHGYRTKGHELSNALLHLESALNPQVHLVNLANVTIANDGRFLFLKHPHTAQNTPQSDPVQYEADLTKKALAIVDGFAPGFAS